MSSIAWSERLSRYPAGNLGNGAVPVVLQSGRHLTHEGQPAALRNSAPDVKCEGNRIVIRRGNVGVYAAIDRD